MAFSRALLTLVILTVVHRQCACSNATSSSVDTDSGNENYAVVTAKDKDTPSDPSDTKTVTASPGLPQEKDDTLDKMLVSIYNMVNFFLRDIVQTKDLNALAEKGVDFSDPDDVVRSLQEDWKVWTLHYIGYAICVGIGVLLIIIMPIVGLVTCCCRTCCNKCGAKVSPMESKNAGSKRLCCGTVLFIITSVLLVSGIVMVLTALRFHKELSDPVESVFESVAKSVEIVGNYTATTLEELDQHTLGEFGGVKNDVFSLVDEVVQKAVDKLEEESQALVLANRILNSAKSLENITSDLNAIEHIATEFTKRGEILSESLNNISATLRTATGDSPEFDKLTVGPYLTGIGNINSELQKALDVNIADTIESGIKSYKETIETIDAAVSADIGKMKSEINDIEQQLNKSLAEATKDIAAINFQNVTHSVRENAELPVGAWDVVLWIFLGLAGVVGLIVFCLLMGLLFGACCPRAKHHDGAFCTTRLAAIWLLAGVGFIFLFYWLLVLIVMIMFLMGGLMDTELCRYLVEPAQSEVLDEALKMAIDTKKFNISIGDIYQNCKNNEAFYTAMNAESNGFNISQAVDISAVDREISKVKNIAINIGTVEILSGDTKNDLRNISDTLNEMLGVFDENYKELEKETVGINLTSFANVIAPADDDRPVTDEIRELQAIAETLKSLDSEYVQPMTEQKQELASLLQSINASIHEVNIDKWIADIGSAEDIINNKGDDIIGSVVNETANAVYADVMHYYNRVENALRYGIGNCRPIYRAYMIAIDAVCVQLLYPLNGYWFALGCCLFFFLPAIVISFKMATLYRKTLRYSKTPSGHYEDPYDAYLDSTENLSPGYSTDMLLQDYDKRRVPYPGGVMPISNPMYERDDIVYRIPRPQYYDQRVPVLPHEPLYADVNRPTSRF